MQPACATHQYLSTRRPREVIFKIFLDDDDPYADDAPGFAPPPPDLARAATSVLVYGCEHCAQFRLTAAALRQHWQTAHAPAGAPFAYHIDQPVRCLLCADDRSRVLRRRYRQHAARHHAGQPICLVELQRPQQCALCPYLGGGRRSMLGHARRHHAPEPLPDAADGGPLLERPLVPILDASLQHLLRNDRHCRSRCTVCLLRVRDEPHARRHFARRHGGRPVQLELEPDWVQYACPLCDERTDSVRLMVQHVHGGHDLSGLHRRYRCACARLTFATEAEWWAHSVREHRDNRLGWQLAPVRQRLAVFTRIRLVFPTGLVACLAELEGRRWGCMRDVVRCVEALDKAALLERRRVWVRRMLEQRRTLAAAGVDASLELKRRHDAEMAAEVSAPKVFRLDGRRADGV